MLVQRLVEKLTQQQLMAQIDMSQFTGVPIVCHPELILLIMPVRTAMSLITQYAESHGQLFGPENFIARQP